MLVVEDAAVRCLLPSQVANLVKQRIERSEIIKDCGESKEVLVCWDQDEAEVLAQIVDEGCSATYANSVPAPIRRDYTWPGMFKPFKHQLSTAEFLSIRRRAFCFNEAGTGKTSAAIWAADYLMNIGAVKRVLVICPLSIMYTAWQSEVFKTATHRSAAVAHGEKTKRAKIIDADYDFVIINYDGVEIVRENIAKANFDLIIIDEANAYKSPSTKRWKTLARLLMPSLRVWMMTGTPASQSPVDAYGLARIIAPWKVPKYLTAWRDKVMVNQSRFKWIPRPNSQHIVFDALQPAIRFTKKECLDLPDVTYQTRLIPLTPQAARYYKILKTQMLIEAAGEQISAVNAAASINKLLQISGGAVYTDTHEVVEFDISNRLNALKEVLDEASHKVIVFVPYIHTIEIVTKFLNSQNISNEVIKGDVSARRRSEIINNFQSQPTPHVLVIQPQSASHGVTLTAADTIVFWSPVMSVETYIQCIGRIDRVGQKHKMTVVHLQGSEVERRIYAMLQGKVNSHLKLVDLYKQELDLV